MKSHRFHTGYRTNASKLHRIVGDSLRDSTGPFAGHRVYQEYPVNKVNSSFFSGAYKFDWVDLDLRLVIECHGKQHYEATNFGGGNFKKAEENFAFIRASDASKRDAAINAGWTYIIVPYWDIAIVSPGYLWCKYQYCLNTFRPEKPSKKPESEYNLRMKERAREYRKQQYCKAKELKGRLKNETQND